MPSKPRAEIVRAGEVAVYHCWSRCVRRAFLCGQDTNTGKNFEYRREWIRECEEALAGLFGIEVGFHAEMSNHLHLVLRTRPDVVATWSDKEVVQRWLAISHLTKSRDGKVKSVKPLRIALELALPGRVKILRDRLSHPSFFMAALCEHVARRSNREDECRGRFWEDRFKCRELACESSVVVCGIYIDLNQIRAGEASTPEESTHTSAFERIVSLRQTSPSDASPDGWMCEFTIDESAAVNDASFTQSVTSRRASDKGLLSMSLIDYLQLLEATGRAVRSDNRGVIPASVEPILGRLGLPKETWIDLINNYHQWFGHIVGTSQTLVDRAQRAGRRWYRGRPCCASIFG